MAVKVSFPKLFGGFHYFELLESGGFVSCSLFSCRLFSCPLWFLWFLSRPFPFELRPRIYACAPLRAAHLATSTPFLLPSYPASLRPLSPSLFPPRLEPQGCRPLTASLAGNTSQVRTKRWVRAVGVVWRRVGRIGSGQVCQGTALRFGCARGVLRMRWKKRGRGEALSKARGREGCTPDLMVVDGLGFPRVMTNIFVSSLLWTAFSWS